MKSIQNVKKTIANAVAVNDETNPPIEEFKTFVNVVLVPPMQTSLVQVVPPTNAIFKLLPDSILTTLPSERVYSDLGT